MRVARDPRLQLADARHQFASVIARPIAAACLGALVGRRARQLRHLGFEHFLEYVLHQRLNQVPVAGAQRFR
jgi:hypothetical protein